MLDFACIPVGSGGPLACWLCAPRAERHYHPVARIVEEIGDATRSCPDATGPNVCLGGAEPFGHPELPQLVTACRREGARRIALETDASALSLPANASGVIVAGVHHLHARLLDVDEAHGDEMTGRPGMIRDALAGIASYIRLAAAASADVVVTLVVPVCAHNLGSLPAIVSRGASLGVHAVRLIAGPALHPSAPSLLSAACDTGMVNGVWVETDELLPMPDSHRLHIVPGGSCGG